MSRKKKEPNPVDEFLDKLLEDCTSPEDILGEGGLMKQLKKRLVERALAGELNGTLNVKQQTTPSPPIVEMVAQRKPLNPRLYPLEFYLGL